MLERHRYLWPRGYARIGGALYLLIIAFGLFAEGYVNNRVLVPGDAAKTVANLSALHTLWVSGVVVNTLVPLLAVPLLVIEYLLLKPVSARLALIALLFNITSLAIEAVSKLFLLAIQTPLERSALGKAFQREQLEALTSWALHLHDLAFNLALLFFALTLVIYGVLIYQSRYIPKTVGILVGIAGLCYLIACTAALWVPVLSEPLFPWILLPPFVGEAAFCLWLLIKGINMREWIAQESARMQPSTSLAHVSR